MKKKTISVVLIVSFLSYIGCYNTEKLTQEDLAATSGQRDIAVVTVNSQRYEFSKGRYRVQSDSLTGTGLRKGLFKEIPFQGSIPLSEIAVIEVSEFSVGKTILFAGGVSLAVAGFIALANGGRSSTPPPQPTTGTKLSCPFIYTFDGERYHFESETFAGSVFKGIERPAYDVLYHLKPVDGTCRLKLVNAREETEYVNELKVFAVDHPVGTTVIPDRAGVIHTISNPIQPISCVDMGGSNALAAVREKDGSYWQSNLTDRDWTDERSLRDGLVVEFPKPAGSKSVKLVVNGKNTRLGYFALAEIFQLKGDNKLDWYRQLESDSTERVKFVRWLMREGMLHVKVWHDGEWLEKAALTDVGPGISKEQVAVFDISDITDDVLRIRVECTTDLWCIDQIYADYSPDRAIQATELPLQGAFNEQGANVADVLSVSDDKYYTTISGQYATIEFADVPRTPHADRSYLAKTTGFYYQWLDAEGPAQDEKVERMLVEPMFGAKVLMPQWLKQREQYEGITEGR